MPHYLPAAATGHQTRDVTAILPTLFAVILAAKLSAGLFERLRRPAVAGEILACLLVGPPFVKMLFASEQNARDGLGGASAVTHEPGRIG